MISDEDLMLEYKKGSKAAFEAIVNRYHRPIYNYIYRMSRQQELSEDLVQECFLKVFSKADYYKYPRPFKPWIYSIARNLFYDYCRRNKGKDMDLFVHEMQKLPDENKGPLDFLEHQEKRSQVVQALQDLPDPHREILILRFYHELKLKEIAEVVDLPLGTVKSRLYWGIRKMGELLREEEVYEEVVR